MQEPPWSNNDREEESTSRSQSKSDSQEIGLDSAYADRLKWEDYLIGLLLLYPALYEHVYVIIDGGDFAGTDTRELYRIIDTVYQRDSSPLLQSFERHVPSVLLTALDRVHKRVEALESKDGALLIKEAVQCAIRLKRMQLLQLNTELKYLMSEAAESGEYADARQFYGRISEIHQQLHTLNGIVHLHG